MGDEAEEIVISDIEVSSSSEKDSKDIVTVNCRRVGFRKELLRESIKLRVTQGSRLQDVWFEACAGSPLLRGMGYKKLTKEVDVCNERAKTREVFHAEHFVRDLPTGFNHLLFIVEENQRTREAIVRGDVPVSSSAPLPQGRGILAGARSKRDDDICAQHSRKSASFSRDATSSPKSASFSKDTNFGQSRSRSGPQKRRSSSQSAPQFRHDGDEDEFSDGHVHWQNEDDSNSTKALHGYNMEQHGQRFSLPNGDSNGYDPRYVGHLHEPGQNLPFNEPFADSIQDHPPAFFAEGSHEFRHSATLPMPIPNVEDDLRMQEANRLRHFRGFLPPPERWSFEDHHSHFPY